MLILVFFVVLACVGGWLYGEVKNNQPIRVICALGCMVVFSSIAAAVSGLYTALSAGIPMSTAVHEYLDTATSQLQEGNVDFVVDEFDGFKQRVHITYETGTFLDEVKNETNRMKSGPTQP